VTVGVRPELFGPSLCQSGSVGRRDSDVWEFQLVTPSSAEQLLQLLPTSRFNLIYAMGSGKTEFVGAFQWVACGMSDCSQSFGGVSIRLTRSNTAVRMISLSDDPQVVQENLSEWILLS